MMEVDDSTPELIAEARDHNKSPFVDTWEGALKLLDQYTRSALWPVTIHADFTQQVWTAIRARLDSTTEISRSRLKRWRELCRAD